MVTYSLDFMSIVRRVRSDFGGQERGRDRARKDLSISIEMMDQIVTLILSSLGFLTSILVFVQLDGMTKITQALYHLVNVTNQLAETSEATSNVNQNSVSLLTAYDERRRIVSIANLFLCLSSVAGLIYSGLRLGKLI